MQQPRQSFSEWNPRAEPKPQLHSFKMFIIGNWSGPTSGQATQQFNHWISIGQLTLADAQAQAQAAANKWNAGVLLRDVDTGSSYSYAPSIHAGRPFNDGPPRVVNRRYTYQGLNPQPWPQIRNLGAGPDDSIPNSYDTGEIAALQALINKWLKSHGYNLIGSDDDLGHETCRACLYVLGQLDGTVDRCPGECPNSDENWTPTKASAGVAVALPAAPAVHPPRQRRLLQSLQPAAAAASDPS